MAEKNIASINESYDPYQQQGLTAGATQENTTLRKEYIMAIRASVKNTLDHASIEEEDGSIVPLKEKRRRNQKGYVVEC